MPPKPKTKKKGGKKKVVEEDISENLQDDDELLNMEANQQTDQEDLTQEEKDKTYYKKLTSNNPQAPANITKFSYKDRQFKVDDSVDQIVFHYLCDGDILVAESEEARDQEDYLENKKQRDKQLLDQMNSAIREEFGQDERKFLQPLISYTFRRQGRGRQKEVPPQPVLLPGTHFPDLKPPHPRSRLQDRAAQDLDLLC